jgi:predicted membrane protein
MSNDYRDSIRCTSAGLVPGMIVVGIGVLFLLNNLGIVRVHDWWNLWPVILIAIGLTKLVDSPHPNEKSGGAVMLIVGSVFLAKNMGWFTWSIWEWWPILLIGAGLLMLLNRTGIGLTAGIRTRSQSGTGADALAIFGGFKRQISTDDYRGANYTAVFGGGEIDLRRAQIRGDGAIVNIQAIFGGFEIKVPANWIVVNEALGIFGGATDETVHPSPETPGVKQLIVRGSAIFGGFALKN